MKANIQLRQWFGSNYILKLGANFSMWSCITYLFWQSSVDAHREDKILGGVE